MWQFRLWFKAKVFNAISISESKFCSQHSSEWYRTVGAESGGKLRSLSTDSSRLQYFAPTSLRCNSAAKFASVRNTSVNIAYNLKFFVLIAVKFTQNTLRNTLTQNNVIHFEKKPRKGLFNFKSKLRIYRILWNFQLFFN